MKEMSKKAAVVALAGVMTMGMLSGCGEKKVDGTKTVATVDGTEIPMGILSLMVRQSQAQTEAMYASFMGSSDYAIWSTEAEEGKTYGQQMVEESLDQLELMYIMKEKAADYKVEVTEGDQKSIETAAAEFMKENSQETLDKISVTEDQVKTYLELKTYESRMYDPIVADVDTEISDEEAQQSSFSYVSISTVDLDEDEVKAKKEDAQKILDAVKKDPEADFNETVKSVSEDYSGVEGTFDTNQQEKEDEEEDVYSSSYPDEVLKVLRGLEDGEVGPDVIETETGLYVVRLDQKNDKEATESKKESILEDRKSELYKDTTDQWKDEAKITEDEKVLKTLTVTDNNKFTIATTAEETTEDGEAAAETADTASEETSEDEVLVPAEGETEGTEEEASAEETSAEDTSTDVTEEKTSDDSEKNTEAAADVDESADAEGTSSENAAEPTATPTVSAE